MSSSSFMSQRMRERKRLVILSHDFPSSSSSPCSSYSLPPSLPFLLLFLTIIRRGDFTTCWCIKYPGSCPGVVYVWSQGQA